jgi:hypothetical protein
MARKSSCTITSEELSEALKKYGSHEEAAAALGVKRRTLSRWVQVGVPGNIKTAESFAAKTSTAVPKGGINISGLRKSPRKPNTGCKPLFHQIPQGVGFPIDTASEEWGFSVDTIRRAAIELGARVYVETSKDVWIEMVIKPKG